MTFEKLRRSTESATHSFEVLVCLSVGLKAVGSAGGVGSADLSRVLSTDRQSILIKTGALTVVLRARVERRGLWLSGYGTSTRST